MLIKDRFAEIGKDPQSFVVISGETPEGLTSDLLHNLWNFASRFAGGLEGEKGGLTLRHEEMLIVLYDFRNNGQGGMPGMNIFKVRESRTTDEGVFMLGLTSDIKVMWDRGMTVERVTELVRNIDKLAEEHGDLVDGERKSLPILYGVDSTFQMAHTFLPVPSTVSNEEFLEIWDHPELLEIFEYGGRRLVALKSHRAEVEAMIEEQVKEIMEERRGIRPS